ncbi:MAG: hypothetical protein KKA67_15830 [Spirochaetes bacterium]|nr:hypothetical protein [Spirochaetota bacterium]MBU1079570.1 hypothetical protein [Spirochaetota bacterium]
MRTRLALLARLALAAFMASPAGALPGSVSIDLGSPRPYAFNEATVRCADGLSERARLVGTGLDGASFLLFEAEFGYADTVSARYYAWPGLSALEFEGFDGDGSPVTAAVRLHAAGFVSGGDPDASELSSLGFPFRQAPLGRPPRAVGEDGLSALAPEAAARVAASELFAAGRRPFPLAALSLWAVAFVAAAAARWKRGPSGGLRAVGAPGREREPAPLASEAWLTRAAIASAVFAIALIAAGPAPAALYSLRLPSATGSGSGRALAKTERLAGGYRSVSWESAAGAEAPGAPGLAFIGVRSPLSAAVPLEALLRYDRIRFKRPPLVALDSSGRAVLAPGRFAMAWGVYD